MPDPRFLKSPSAPGNPVIFTFSAATHRPKRLSFARILSVWSWWYPTKGPPVRRRFLLSRTGQSPVRARSATADFLNFVIARLLLVYLCLKDGQKSSCVARKGCGRDPFNRGGFACRYYWLDSNGGGMGNGDVALPDVGTCLRGDARRRVQHAPEAVRPRSTSAPRPRSLGRSRAAVGRGSVLPPGTRRPPPARAGVADFARWRCEKIAGTLRVPGHRHTGSAGDAVGRLSHFDPIGVTATVPLSWPVITAFPSPVKAMQ